MFIKNKRIKFLGFLLEDLIIIKDEFNNNYKIGIDKSLNAIDYLVEGEDYTVTIKFEQNEKSLGFMYATIVEI